MLNHQQNIDSNMIDLSLYDRQIRTYGKKASERIISSTVIIYGLAGGYGTEIAKNLVLGGIKQLYLCDNNLINNDDIQTGFYFSKLDIGFNRAHILSKKVRELNPYTQVNVIDTITEQVLENAVLVIINNNFDTTIHYNNMVRNANSKMVYLCSSGVGGFIFVDGGNEHCVFDVSGENIEPVQLSNINKNGLVSCSQHSVHNYQNGDIITFTNLEGENLDFLDSEWTIKTKNRKIFQLENFPQDKKFKFINGTSNFIKKPKTFNFESLEQQILNPTILGFNQKESKLIINTLEDLIKRKINYEPWSDDMYNLTQEYNISMEHLIRSFNTELIPFVSIMGSFASAEVIKLVSGKYVPINQWWTFYEKNLIPSVKNMPTKFGSSPIGKLLGSEYEQKLKDLSVLMVGCGALGCEWLKNMAKLNIGINGNITVTDPDHIEKSNLNRQFLFRPEHISKSKSKTACKMVKQMNSEMKITALTDKITSENQVLTDRLFDNTDIVINALDNLTARRYVDEQCLNYQLPLFESGTMGMKGNTQPVIPFLTETYSNSSDPEQEKSFPVCTIKNFPNEILHTIHWAREAFDFFRRFPDNINKYKNDDTFFNSLSSYDKFQAQTDINECFIKRNIKSWKDCAVWSMDMWYKYYRNDILQLLYGFPQDMLNDNGTKFWSKGKRCPVPLVFSRKNKTHIDYVESTTHLLARCCSLDDTFSRDELLLVISDYTPDDFKPDIDKVMAKNDSELSKQRTNITSEIELPDKNIITKTFTIQEFEKDDDTNWHIAYLTSASNCRALNYNIPLADYYKTKGIAGRIIPAVATTTSVVVGLISLELLKYCKCLFELDIYNSWFVNMANNTIVSSTPIQAPIIKIGEKKINSWLQLKYDIDSTLEEFCKYYNKYLDLNISMVLYSNKILYADFLPPSNNNVVLSKLFMDKFNINIRETNVYVVVASNDVDDIPQIQIKIL